MVVVHNYKKLICHFLGIVEVLQVAVMNGIKVSGYYDCFFLHVNKMSLPSQPFDFIETFACNRAVIFHLFLAPTPEGIGRAVRVVFQC